MLAKTQAAIAELGEEPHHAGVIDVGFNAMQPGKIKRGDLVFLIAAIVVIGALLAWAFFGS